MSYSDIRCQICEEPLNRYSFFSWVKDNSSNPINIYREFNGINNPNNLNCCILYCNENCSRKWSGVVDIIDNTGIADYPLDAIDDDLHKWFLKNETNVLIEDFETIQNIIRR